MKIVKIVSVVFSLLAVVVLSIMLFMQIWRADSDEKSENTKVEINESQESTNGEEVLGADETIRKFADVIFTYDSRVRPFYEGAEKYMTVRAYEQMRAFDGSNENEVEIDTLQIVPVISTLQNLEIYYQAPKESSNSSNVTAIMEVTHSLGEAGTTRIDELIKIEVIKTEEGYKISRCDVINTFER